MVLEWSVYISAIHFFILTNESKFENLHPRIVTQVCYTHVHLWRAEQVHVL